MAFALRIDDPRCREAVERVRQLVAWEGGRAFLVGGCVRDAVLGRPVRDLDVEVFGLSRERLEAVLGKAVRGAAGGGGENGGESAAPRCAYPWSVEDETLPAGFSAAGQRIVIDTSSGRRSSTVGRVQ